jgi:hypothetical protein
MNEKRETFVSDKEPHDRDRDRDQDRDRDRQDRDAGILGINDADPPRDHVPGGRDADATLDDDTTRAGAREIRRSPGATGIDMGAGGSGTDIDRDI